MNKKKIRERKHRLHDEMYIGLEAIAFTITIKPREKLLTNKYIFEQLTSILKKEINNNNCECLAFVMMPDHLHIILQGKDDKSDIKKTIVNFKQFSGFWFRKSKYNFKWQKDFYDHIIRDDNDIMNQVYYVLNNPVRKELVQDWKEYPFIWSSEYDLNELE
jgi:REP element-mobilizing transposase RayT